MLVDLTDLVNLRRLVHLERVIHLKNLYHWKMRPSPLLSSPYSSPSSIRTFVAQSLTISHHPQTAKKESEAKDSEPRATLTSITTSTSGRHSSKATSHSIQTIPGIPEVEEETNFPHPICSSHSRTLVPLPTRT